MPDTWPFCQEILLWTNADSKLGAGSKPDLKSSYTYPGLLGFPNSLRIMHFSSKNYLLSLPGSPQVNFSTKILFPNFFFSLSHSVVQLEHWDNLFPWLRHKPRRVIQSCLCLISGPGPWFSQTVQRKVRGFHWLPSHQQCDKSNSQSKRTFISVVSSLAGFAHASVQTHHILLQVCVYYCFIQNTHCGQGAHRVWIYYFKNLH